jgi:hypothetical protein
MSGLLVIIPLLYSTEPVGPTTSPWSQFPPPWRSMQGIRTMLDAFGRNVREAILYPADISHASCQQAVDHVGTKGIQLAPRHSEEAV